MPALSFYLLVLIEFVPHSAHFGLKILEEVAIHDLADLFFQFAAIHHDLQLLNAGAQGFLTLGNFVNHHFENIGKGVDLITHLALRIFNFFPFMRIITFTDFLCHTGEGR